MVLPCHLSFTSPSQQHKHTKNGSPMTSTVHLSLARRMCLSFDITHYLFFFISILHHSLWLTTFLDCRMENRLVYPDSWQSDCKWTSIWSVDWQSIPFTEVKDILLHTGRRAYAASLTHQHTGNTLTHSPFLSTHSALNLPELKKSV